MVGKSPLLTIVTVAEAAQMYGLNRRSVMRAIDSRRKPLDARQSGTVWLVTLDSLIARWGEPPIPVDSSTLSNPL